MITIKNYQDQKNSIAWSKMPKAIQDNRNDVEGIMEFYDDDDDIKETVDLFFKGINDNTKPVGEIIVATMPKYDFVEPEKKPAPTNELNLIAYTKFKGDKKFGAMDMSDGSQVGNLMYATLIPMSNKQKAIDLLNETKDAGEIEEFELRIGGTNKVEYSSLDKSKAEKKPQPKVEKFDLLVTNAGGATVISNKNKEVNRDYETIAHIFSNGNIKYFRKNLPKEVTDFCEKHATIHTPFDDKRSTKAPVKKETIEDAFLNAKRTRSIMPKSQQMAVLQSGKGEEKQFFIDKIKEFESIFEAAEKRQDKKAMDSIVRAHFFYGKTHWFIFDYNPKENEFFGYVVLNGDTQMAESGYISIDELHTIKGIELDFYWDQKTLIKALQDEYPDEFEDEVEEKPTAKKTTKAPAKAKVKTVINKTIVDNFSPEFLLIRRFWNIIKTETVHVPFRTVQLLYMAFNKAAVERKVRKTSEVAELFTACNKKITTLFEDIPNEDKKPYEIEFTDKKLYNQIKEYVSDVAVNPAIPLLKRFITMQNTVADKTKAKTLQKSIVKLMETDNFEKNRLFKEIQTAEFELNDYILNNSKLEPTIYGLSVPRSVCTNRVKCAGIDKTGKLHKGYKFQEHTGNVIKVRKGKLGSPNVCENRVKCTGLSKNGKLLKGYKFQEGTNKVIKVRKTTQKPAAKKPTTKKKKVVGLGFSDDIEVISMMMPIVPIVDQPTVDYSPSNNTEVVNDPAPEPKQAAPVPVVKNKLMQMQFDSLDFDQGWENFMQNPAKNMKVAIWGAPKNGKTAGSLQMANYLTKFGKVLYNFADQGFNKSTQDLWQMSGLANNPKAEPSDVQTLADLEKEVATGKYTFVFIDMISDYINKEGIKPYEFKERFMKKYPKVSFILVFEVTKGGNFKGDQGWTHIVDAIVTVEDFLMENRGRYGVGSHIVWEEGLKRFNPKKYDEVMDELNPEKLEFTEVERI